MELAYTAIYVHFYGTANGAIRPFYTGHYGWTPYHREMINYYARINGA